MKILTKIEKKLIGIAQRETKKFIAKWKKSPYKWDNERDIQVELTSRLKHAYGIFNKYNAEYKKWSVPGYKQIYSRIRCEPRVYYTDGKGDRCCCKPDIVIFKDLDNPKAPPDDINWRQKKNCPILWLCEIKYNTEITPTNNLTNVKTDWDRKKLRYLLNNREAYTACWLVLFRRDKARKENSIRSGKIREYYVSLPSKRRGSKT